MAQQPRGMRGKMWPFLIWVSWRALTCSETFDMFTGQSLVSSIRWQSVKRPERKQVPLLIIIFSKGPFMFLLIISHHLSCVCIQPSISMIVRLKGSVVTAIHQQHEQKDVHPCDLCVSLWVWQGAVCVCVCCVCGVIELYHCAISRNQCCCVTWWL